MAVKSWLAYAVALFLLTAVITVAPVQHWTIMRHLAANSRPPPDVADLPIPVTGLPAIATRRPNFEVALIAHRGAANLAPENTIPALEAAIELGAEYVELDVRLTADGIPVILHDSRVNRTTDGSGRIDQLEFSQVRALDAGAWFGPEFAGSRIPTLEEALATLQGRACVLWDTKGPPSAEAVRLFRQYGFDHNCLRITFGGFGNREGVQSVKQLLQLWPDAPLLVLARNRTELAQMLDQYPQTRGVIIPFNYINPEFIDWAHAAGLWVMAKALDQSDNERFYEALMAAGVDAILLSNLQLMQSYREARRASLQP